MKHLFPGIFLISLLSVAISGCLGPGKPEKLSLVKDFKLVTIADQYSLKIPNYMSETSSLNSEASFQAQNIFKETYSIVIDESKEEFVSAFKMIDLYDESEDILTNYANAQYNFITENLTVLSKTEMVGTRINGREAMMISIDGKTTEIDYDITYFLTFVEGEENLYMMMNWTLKKNKHRLLDTFNKIAHSLEVNR